MKIIDFNRTFFFELDLVTQPPQTVSHPRRDRHHRARIRIDCHCHIAGPTGKSASYYLGQSRETERVGCSRRMGLFIKPNADFSPELKKDTLRVGSTFSLAHVAFNSARWAEFIIQKPTPVGKGLSVNHYSQVAQVDCKNTIFALT